MDRPALWHYTCRHGADGISESGGVLLPMPQPFLGGRPLVWVTSHPEASRDALGLTSRFIVCDRMETLWRVDDPHDCWPWITWVAARGADPRTVAALEVGRRPSYWWVSEVPLRAHRVPTWAEP